jgi:hypothetical protein
MTFGRKYWIVFTIIAQLQFAIPAFSESDKGEVELQRVKSAFDQKGVYSGKITGAAEVEYKFYIKDFFKKDVIFANATVINKTKENKVFVYHVAFFNEKDELIGCVSQSTGKNPVEPEGTIQLGSCIIRVPEEKFSEVKKFQVAVYEDVQLENTP